MIRTAEPEDAESAGRVMAAAFATVRSIYEPTATAKANLSAITPTLERLVAEHDGQIVGTVRFGVEEDRLRVIGLAVHPELQRRGVARALIDALVKLAKEKHCRALSLFTVTATGNVAVFARLAFRVISEEIGEYVMSPSGERLTETHMERVID